MARLKRVVSRRGARRNIAVLRQRGRTRRQAAGKAFGMMRTERRRRRRRR